MSSDFATECLYISTDCSNSAAGIVENACDAINLLQFPRLVQFTGLDEAPSTR